jgi:pilus assembly protein CpaE
MAGFATSIRRKAANPAAASPVRVAVIEDDAVVLHHLIDALGDEEGVHPYLSLDELVSESDTPLDGLVLVLGPSQMDEVVLDRTSALLQMHRAGALVVVEEVDASVLRVALRAGVDDAVAMSSVERDLPQAVRDLSFRLRSLHPTNPAPTRGPGDHRGRITTVVSPKGGVGKSVVAVNLAAALAQGTDGSVALVDFDVSFGDVAVMLRIKPDHHVGEAAAVGARLDHLLMESLLIRDERTRLSILAAPPGGAQGERITADSVTSILSVLRTVVDHVVVDTAPGLDDNVLQILTQSDDIVYVVGMDIPSVKNARLGLQALEVIEVPLNRVVLVLNRSDSRVHLAQRDIEKTLQMKVDACLPSDALVPQSVNMGAPAVLEFARSRFAGRIRELASMIAARAQEASGT